MKRIIITLYFFSIFIANAQELNVFNDDRFNCINSDNNRGEMTLCDSIYGYEWHPSSWLLYRKDFTTYNLDGQVTVKEEYEKNDENEWQKKWRREWTYDENGLFIEYLYQKLDPYTLEFKNFLYHYHTFNEQELLEIDSILIWNDLKSSWIPYGKDIYSYNNGIVDTLYSEEWDEEMGEWIHYSLDIYRYNSNDDLLETLNQKWNNTNNNWVNSQKVSYDYYDNNKLSEKKILAWNSIEETWINYFIYHYYYDVNEFLVEVMREYWDSELNQWISQFHYLNTNDEAGNLVEKISQYWFEYNSTWIDDIKDIYYNSVHQTTGVDTENDDSDIVVYPNPTKNIVYILNNQSVEYELNIINTNGQILVKNKLIKNKQEYIDLNGLQNGIYFLQFSSKEKGSFVKKITKF